MKKLTVAIVGGIGLGILLYRRWRVLRRISNFHLTNEDLQYSDRSAQELVSDHLVDLNSAVADQIAGLGLSPSSIERLLENRPYRTKLELVSRMILSQEEYISIKDRVSVAEARQPVKIA